MKAMILAAGRGTRLRPLTDTIPKALVEVNGKTLLQRVVEKLKTSGYDEIIVNVHHFAGQVLDFLKSHDNFGIRICISDESDRLLDTGGGIRKASWFFDDGKPFLVYNTDVICDIDLGVMRAAHLASGATATLAIRTRQSSRYFLFDESLRLKGWRNLSTNETLTVQDSKSDLKPFAFSGIQILDASVPGLMPWERPFPLAPFYLELAGKHVVKGFLHNGGYWFDAGKTETLQELQTIVKD